jgi:hypothetical protein
MYTCCGKELEVGCTSRSTSPLNMHNADNKQACLKECITHINTGINLKAGDDMKYLPVSLIKLPSKSSCRCLCCY